MKFCHNFNNKTLREHNKISQEFELLVNIIPIIKILFVNLVFDLSQT
jgi:hypothetical protein